MRFAVRVEVRRRAGIADPEGRTIEAALPAIGIDNVSGVRMGRSIRFFVAAPDAGAARAIADVACRRLLANPVLEEYSVDEVVLDDVVLDEVGEAAPGDGDGLDEATTTRSVGAEVGRSDPSREASSLGPALPEVS